MLLTIGDIVSNKSFYSTLPRHLPFLPTKQRSRSAAVMPIARPRALQLAVRGRVVA
ncbi:hypothetical protein [Bradyrhizobium sp. STM 3557]|uniref:hypothetical protein n=1 Tax=Bradyrhizobium sp. STM 3557 TaxID=578920 RepID=UPI003890886A